MLINIMSPKFNFEDERGIITQLVDGGYTDVNVVFTKREARRGRMHYHKINTEAFYIINGGFSLKCIHIENRTTEDFVFRGGDMFSIPPFVGHDFKFSEDTLLVSMYSHGVVLPNGTKDIVEIE